MHHTKHTKYIATIAIAALALLVAQAATADTVVTLPPGASMPATSLIEPPPPQALRADGGLSAHLLSDPTEEPTKDYSSYPTITPSIRPRPTTDPVNGLYVGMSAAEVAEAIRATYDDALPGPVSVVAYADVFPQDAEPLGLYPEQIERGDSPDVAAILSGSFPGGMPGAPPSTAPHILVVVDRLDGTYAVQPSDNLDDLLSQLP